MRPRGVDLIYSRTFLIVLVLRALQVDFKQPAFGFSFDAVNSCNLPSGQHHARFNCAHA